MTSLCIQHQKKLIFLDLNLNHYIYNVHIYQNCLHPVKMIDYNYGTLFIVIIRSGKINCILVQRQNQCSEQKAFVIFVQLFKNEKSLMLKDPVCYSDCFENYLSESQSYLPPCTYRKPRSQSFLFRQSHYLLSFF